MNKTTLTAPNGAHAEVFEYGAHVSSWALANGDERLYLSPKSALDGSAAIRGGVPIIFPQFSNEGPLQGLLPRHGFARTTAWEVSDLREDGESVLVDLHLMDTAATRTIWPQPFFARFQVRVGGRSLEMSLQVTNRSDALCSFTCALHTYIRVNDIRQTHIEGLSGTRYRISGGDKSDVREDNEDVLRIQSEVDRIYLNAPDVLTVRESGRESERATEVHKQGFADCVIWNPWAEKCAALKDMPAEGYLNMLCVEAAQIGAPVQLEAGQSWTGVQTLVAIL